MTSQGKEFLAAVREMRDLQRRFFKGERTGALVAQAKVAEARVDRLLAAIEGEQDGLFAEVGR